MQLFEYYAINSYAHFKKKQQKKKNKTREHKNFQDLSHLTTREQMSQLISSTNKQDAQGKDTFQIIRLQTYCSIVI